VFGRLSNPFNSDHELWVAPAQPVKFEHKHLLTRGKRFSEFAIGAELLGLLPQPVAL
jgi:hypothetical protein